MKVRYNAPVTLTFTLVCAAILLLNMAFPTLILSWFSGVGRGAFHLTSVRSYIRLFSHIFGHADMNHFLGNFAIILLLGPLLESRYGSAALVVMIAVTALVTGVLNILFFSTGLYGASGIVFMMILLSSFTNFKQGEIPMTFILIVVLYLGREVINAFQANTISEFAHIIGGLCGSVFGYLKPVKNLPQNSAGE